MTESAAEPCTAPRSEVQQQEQQKNDEVNASSREVARKGLNEHTGHNMGPKRTAAEKRAQDSSGASSSSGDCTSVESRAESMHTENASKKDCDHKPQEEPEVDKQKSAAKVVESTRAAATANDGEKPKLPRPIGTINCPRCNSVDTKFCYYNNYNINQPRYFCKACQRYWTSGGTLRNVPVGAGKRKHKSAAKSNHGDEVLLKRSKSAGSTPGSCSPAITDATRANAAALRGTPLPHLNLLSQLERTRSLVAVAAKDGKEVKDANSRRVKSRSKRRLHQQLVDSSAVDVAQQKQHVGRVMDASATPSSTNGGSGMSSQTQDSNCQQTLQAMLQLGSNGFIQAATATALSQQMQQNLVKSNWAQQAWQNLQQQLYQAGIAMTKMTGEGGQQVQSAWPLLASIQRGAPVQQNPAPTATPNNNNSNSNSGSGSLEQETVGTATVSQPSQDTSSQAPWWYLQMVNNFAAAQNPAAMTRSSQLQSANMSCANLDTNTN